MIVAPFLVTPYGKWFCCNLKFPAGRTGSHNLKAGAIKRPPLRCAEGVVRVIEGLPVMKNPGKLPGQGQGWLIDTVGIDHVRTFSFEIR